MPKQKTINKTLTFSGLKLEQAIFEVRSYNRGHLPAVVADFWDTVEKTLEVSIVYGFQEAASVARLGKSLELSVASDRFSVIQFFPSKDLKEYFHTAAKVFSAYIDHLRTENIARVGFRLIYSMDFDDPMSVAKQFLQLPYVSVTDGLTLAESGRPVIPTYSVGYNDGQKAMVYRLMGNTGKLSVDLPPILAHTSDYPETIEKIYNQFVFDVDVFTSAPLLTGELIVIEWLEQAYDAVRTDGVKFFGK
ncbi:MAG: hypothetical protein IPJ55_18680 [Chloracidobacterium sp.]|nr:hypothetical protein [Chloracidobacterium sp.]